MSDDDAPRTYRSGPSDPVRYEDGPGTWVERRVAAPASAVWAAVTDIGLPPRFSDELVETRWLSDERGLGARFAGRNRHPAIGEWETECTVVSLDEETVFAWAVGDPEEPVAIWTFTLGGDGAAATTLRFEVTLGPGPSGTTMAIASMPDKEDRIIRRRVSDLHANMRRTVDGIASVAEGS